MKWIVLEENPQPDNYIAVMVADESRVLRTESKPCAIFKSSDEAILHARQLRELYKVRNIRIFYMESSSAFV
jgi:hypothetical protein